MPNLRKLINGIFDYNGQIEVPKMKDEGSEPSTEILSVNNNIYLVDHNSIPRGTKTSQIYDSNGERIAFYSKLKRDGLSEYSLTLFENGIEKGTLALIQENKNNYCINFTEKAPDWDKKGFNSELYNRAFDIFSQFKKINGFSFVDVENFDKILDIVKETKFDVPGYANRNSFYVEVNSAKNETYIGVRQFERSDTLIGTSGEIKIADNKDNYVFRKFEDNGSVKFQNVVTIEDMTEKTGFLCSFSPYENYNGLISNDFKEILQNIESPQSPKWNVNRLTFQKNLEEYYKAIKENRPAQTLSVEDYKTECKVLGKSLIFMDLLFGDEKAFNHSLEYLKDTYNYSDDEINEIVKEVKEEIKTSPLTEVMNSVNTEKSEDNKEQTDKQIETNNSAIEQDEA